MEKPNQEIQSSCQCCLRGPSLYKAKLLYVQFENSACHQLRFAAYPVACRVFLARKSISARDAQNPYQFAQARRFLQFGTCRESEIKIGLGGVCFGTFSNRP